MKDKQRSTSQVKDKHTPGPWTVTPNGSIEFNGGFIGEAYDTNPGYYGKKTEALPTMANARLIAAAPELLEFVQNVAEGLNTGGNPGHLEDAVEFLQERAQRIIAKIEGNE